MSMHTPTRVTVVWPDAGALGPLKGLLLNAIEGASNVNMRVIIDASRCIMVISTGSVVPTPAATLARMLESLIQIVDSHAVPPNLPSKNDISIGPKCRPCTDICAPTTKTPAWLPVTTPWTPATAQQLHASSPASPVACMSVTLAGGAVRCRRHGTNRPVPFQSFFFLVVLEKTKF